MSYIPMKQFILAAILIFTLLLPASLFSQQKADESFKQELLDRINRTRQQGCKCGTQYMRPVAPIVWNNQLEDAALAHARDMGEHNYFSHTSRNGRSSGDRIIAAGYDYNGYKSYAVGENIAFGQEEIAEVMAGWFKSPGHCKNLMNPDFKEVGVAEYNTYWVQDFGGRISFSEEQQKLIRSGKMKIIQRQVQ
jgi:uncharacterized protein YkwD